MPLESNPSVGTGGAGVCGAGGGGGGLGLHPTGSVGLGGNGLCGDAEEEPCVGAIPVITSLDPSSVFEGSGTFVLEVTGTGFLPISVIIFNGIERVTTYISSTKLQATISAADVAAAGSFDVQVDNPDPGCGPSNIVVFPVEAEAVPTTGLRFMIDENFGGDPSFNIIGWRVQEAGSRAVYRHLATDLDVSLGVVAVMGPARFSPDATKLVVLYDISPGFGAPPEVIDQFLVRVYDLGTTLTSASDLGDDVHLLDADVINEVYSGDNTSFDWVDVAVNNDGDLWVLEALLEPDEVLTNPIWTIYPYADVQGQAWFEVLGDFAGTPFQISILADPRGNLTDSRTYTLTSDCGNPTTIDFIPTVAWWDGIPDPLETSSEVTLDITGLAESEYEELGPVVNVNLGSGCVVNDLHLSLEGEHEGETGLLQNIHLRVDIPTREVWSLKKKTIAGALTTQSSLLNPGIMELAISNKDTQILDAENNLIFARTQDAGERFPAVIDLSADLSPLAVDATLSADTQPFQEVRPGIITGTGGTYTTVAATNLSTEPADPIALLVQTILQTPVIYRITNSEDNLLPETKAIDPSPSTMLHTAITADRTGYAVGGIADSAVRTVIADGDEVTYSELPGTLNISPGESDPEKVRAIPTNTPPAYDLDIYWAAISAYRPLIKTIGYGGIPPEEL